MRTRAPLTVVVAALLAATAASRPARADDDPARALLDSLAEKDPRVLGRSYFGIHVGRKNVGWLVVDIAATSSGSESYHSFAGAKVAIGDEGAAIEEKGLLDRKLAPATLARRAVEGTKGELATVWRVERTKEGFTSWVPSKEKAGKTTRFVAPRPLIVGTAARIAFVRSLDAKKKATYRVASLELEGSIVLEQEVEVKGVPEDGLYPVVVHDLASGEATRLLVDPDAPPAKRIVRFKQTNEDLEYVLAPDEAGARKDLPLAPRPPEGSPRATILAYLEAVERRDAKKLEPLIDWPALQRSLDEKGALDAWKKSFLEQVAAREDDPDHGPHAPALDLIPKLKEDAVNADALEARVRIEGEKGVFKLVREKPGAPWKIAQLPD